MFLPKNPFMRGFTKLDIKESDLSFWRSHVKVQEWIFGFYSSSYNRDKISKNVHFTFVLKGTIL